MSDDKNDNLDIKINLDARAAISSVQELSGKIGALSESNLSGLISGFTRLSGPIFAAGAAAFAVKKAFDFALEGEQLIQLDERFNKIATSAGVSATTIKQGMDDALKGTVDMSDAIQSTNQAMIKLGTNSEKIPQLWQIARNAGKTMGIDTTQAFDTLTTAIANGNGRMLKSLGIIVDNEQALIKYAKAHNLSVGALSEHEKKQAIMNAALDQAKTKFGDNSNKAESLNDSLKRFLNTAKDVGEEVAKFFSKAFGPAFQTVLNFMSEKFENLGTVLKAKFGDGADAAAAKVSLLEKEIGALTDRQKALNEVIERGKKQSLNFEATVDRANAERELIGVLSERKQKELELYTVELEQAEKQRAQSGEALVNKAKQEKEINAKNLEEHLLAQAKFEKELLSLKQGRLNAEKENISDEFVLKNAQIDEFLLIDQQYDQKVAEIKANAAKNNGVTADQAAQMILEIEGERAAKLQSLEDKQAYEIASVYDYKMKHAESFSEYVQAASKKETDTVLNAEKQKQQMYEMTKTRLMGFFKTLGTSSESVAEQMKKAMLGFLGEYVTKKGETMMLEAFDTWPVVRVPTLAAGGALMALGSALGAASSGGSSPSGGSSGISSPQTDFSSARSAPTPEETKQKTVTIQVQGNYFETEQTKTRLLEMIRETTDATDYKYQQIGVS